VVNAIGPTERITRHRARRHEKGGGPKTFGRRSSGGLPKHPPTDGPNSGRRHPRTGQTTSGPAFDGPCPENRLIRRHRSCGGGRDRETVSRTGKGGDRCAGHRLQAAGPRFAVPGIAEAGISRGRQAATQPGRGTKITHRRDAGRMFSGVGPLVDRTSRASKGQTRSIWERWLPPFPSFGYLLSVAA